jgi:GDP-L-fucose synthase
MTLEGKNILVTGATGLIGSNVIGKLKQIPDCNVVAIYHKNYKLTGGVLYAEGDLLNPDFCDKITKNIDIIFHCAANSSGAAVQETNPLTFVKPNVIMNLNLFEAAHSNDVKKIIWLASTTGYPYSEEPITEDKMFEGDPYDKYFAVGWMKRYTEKLCQMFSEKLKKKTACIVLRPTNIYGPNDKIDPNRSHVLTALIRKVVEKQNPIEVWGDGQDIRDVLYVDDMVNAMITSAEKLDTFEQINIGYGKSYTVLELLEMIKKVSSYDAPYKLIPTGPRMIPVRKVNIDKAKNVLNWEPKIDIKEGIKRTYEWVSQELRNK